MERGVSDPCEQWEAGLEVAFRLQVKVWIYLVMSSELGYVSELEDRRGSRPGLAPGNEDFGARLADFPSLSLYSVT